MNVHHIQNPNGSVFDGKEGLLKMVVYSTIPEIPKGVLADFGTIDAESICDFYEVEEDEPMLLLGFDFEEGGIFDIIEATKENIDRYKVGSWYKIVCEQE